jgi:hypothetical protein
VNEPIVVLLKYTFASNSVLTKNSIQTGLGGVRLIPTVEDLNEVVTNGSDVVAVQIHLRLVSFRVVSNFGVVFLPVLVVRNGSVHFLFDLTHGGNCNPLCASLLTGQRTCRNGRQQRSRSPHRWQSNRNAHRTSQPPDQRVPWYRRGSPAGLAGSGQRRGCLSCDHYKHGVGRFGVNGGHPANWSGSRPGYN